MKRCPICLHDTYECGGDKEATWHKCEECGRVFRLRKTDGAAIMVGK